MIGSGTVIRIACLAPLLAAAACYESSEPLGRPEQGIVDAHLLGTWRCEDPADVSKEVAHLVVVPFDRSQYYLEWHEDRKVERYRAYSTQLQETTVFNVTELKPAAAASTWMFLRAIPRRDGAFSLSVVNNDSVKSLKGPAALSEIARRAGDDSLYKVWAVCMTENRRAEL